ATNQSHVVLLAGLAGAIASALSMGSGAYLATKSEGEVHRAEYNRERTEVLEHPDEEIEELELFYQLKGLNEDDAKLVARRLAEDPGQLVRALAQEALGISGERTPSTVMSALTSSVATLFAT